MRKVSVVVAAGVVLLAGCGAPEPYPASEARAHYDDVLLGARTILEQTGIEWEGEVYRPSVEQDGATCVFNPGAINPVDPPDRWAVLRHPDFESVMLPELNDLLTDNGFTQLSDVTESGNGGWRTATDGHGATFKLGSDTGFSINGAVVDADPCTPESLGLSA